MTDHISHEFCRITPNGEELEIGAGDKILKDIMRRKTNAVTVSLKLVPKRNERLHVATTADDLYDDVQRQGPFFIDIHRLWCGSK